METPTRRTQPMACTPPSKRTHQGCRKQRTGGKKAFRKHNLCSWRGQTDGRASRHAGRRTGGQTDYRAGRQTRGRSVRRPARPAGPSARRAVKSGVRSAGMAGGRSSNATGRRWGRRAAGRSLGGTVGQPVGVPRCGGVASSPDATSCSHSAESIRFSRPMLPFRPDAKYLPPPPACTASSARCAWRPRGPSP